MHLFRFRLTFTAGQLVWDTLSALPVAASQTGWSMPSSLVRWAWHPFAMGAGEAVLL